MNLRQTECQTRLHFSCGSQAACSDRNGSMKFSIFRCPLALLRPVWALRLYPEWPCLGSTTQSSLVGRSSIRFLAEPWGSYGAVILTCPLRAEVSRSSNGQMVVRQCADVSGHLTSGAQAASAVWSAPCPAQTEAGTKTAPAISLRAVRTSAARRITGLSCEPASSNSAAIVPEGCSITIIRRGPGGSTATPSVTEPGRPQAAARHNVPVTAWAEWQASGTK